MLGYIKEKLYKLADQLLQPIWDRLVAAGWATRFVVILIGIMLAGTIAYPNTARDELLKAECFYHALVAQGDVLPVDSARRDVLKILKSHLTFSVRNDFARLTSGVMTPWSSAQGALALSTGGDLGPTKPEDVVSFIRTSKEASCACKVGSCGCWHEAAGSRPTDPVCAFASGWIFMAFAALNVAVQPDELNFVVQLQGSDGWWPMFPVNVDQMEYASSYATGWIILGLQAQTERVNDFGTPGVMRLVSVRA